MRAHKDVAAPRLSIVIPAVESVSALEATLVAVLQNRPAQSEIIVVLNRDYDDPYALASEVQFIRANAGAGYLDCANFGIAQSRADVVHVLAAGMEPSEGWADAAVENFRDERVAAVAPVVLAAQDSAHVLAAGLRYAPGGATCDGRATICDAARAESCAAFGACGFAAFYRREALAAVGGFSSAVGERLADVELAWTLRRLGYTCVFEPRSRILAEELPRGTAGAFQEGLYAERLFWRNASAMGWTKSLMAHSWAVAWELATGLPRPGAVLRLAGRLLACCQVGDYRRHASQLARLTNVEAAPSDAAPSSHSATIRRVDLGHAGTRSSQPGAARGAAR